MVPTEQGQCLDDGAQIVGVKSICQLSIPPYEFGFPKEVEKMVHLHYDQLASSTNKSTASRD